MLASSKRGLAPLTNSRTRVLILGTFPSEISLQQRHYYANKSHNSFWRIMAQIIETPNESNLLQSKMGLWDVYAMVKRKGSQDSAIDKKSAQLNNFNSFFKNHKCIELICFNGSKAYELYVRRVLPCLSSAFKKIHLETPLPSTSCSNTHCDFAEKLSQWRKTLNKTINFHQNE